MATNLDRPAGPETLSDLRLGELYTKADVVRVLKTNRTTLNRLAKAGRITRRKVGSRSMFLGADVLRLVDLDAPPPRSETSRQRQERGEAALRRIAEIAAGK